MELEDLIKNINSGKKKYPLPTKKSHNFLGLLEQ